MFLYETLDGLRRREAPPLPAWIRENLNPRLPLRSYQEAAFQNFSLYWERLRRRDRLRSAGRPNGTPQPPKHDRQSSGTAGRKAPCDL